VRGPAVAGKPKPAGRIITCVSLAFSRGIRQPACPRRKLLSRSGNREDRESAMMNALPVLIVVWAILTGLFLALLAYNGTITRYEDNQLFLADINANEQQRQTTIVRRVNKTLPFVRVFGTLSAILTVVIITIYTWDSWLKLH
jgi:hypothetical protein